MGSQKLFANNFGLQISSQESPLKNEKNDTKIIYIGHIEAELWAFKVWGYLGPPTILTPPSPGPWWLKSEKIWHISLTP
jgi:hypothetical protein